MSSSNNNDRVYIVAATRTPIGKYGGKLASVSAVELGTIAVRSVLQQSKLSDASAVEELYFGNVISANVGQAPARQVAIASGLSHSIACTTVNKVCASGMKAMEFGLHSILVHKNDIVICGGMESMSNAPYYIAASDIRVPSKPKSMANKTLVDGMIKDGLWDVYSDQHMGHCADLCATQHNISRAAQDEFAIESFKRAQYATQNGIFAKEITPVSIRHKNRTTVIDTDEGCLHFDAAKMRKLRPAFNKHAGTVTAANASQLSDGAAALMLVSERKLHALGLTPLAEIVGYADAGKKPVEFTTAPSLAIPKALKNAGLTMADLNENDYFEINEAFAVVGLANAKLLGIPIERVNVYGGGVAIGHPLGCSGARIVVTLLNALKHKQGRYGVAGICNGGGGASAMVIRNCQNAKCKL